MGFVRHFGLWTLGALFCTATAWGQPTGRHGRDDERARHLQELAQQAQAAQAAGNHQGALDLALQIERLAVNPSVLMFIAEEYQALYRPADSREYADRCIRAVEATRFALNDREAVLQRCRELRSAGENGFGSLRLVLPEDAPAELRVFVAGRQVAPDARGAPQAVPIGEVEVEATAPGYFIARQRVTVRARETSEARIQLTAVPVCRDGACPQTPGGRMPDAYRPSRAGPVTLMVTGGVLLLAAGAVWVFGDIPRTADANVACPNRACSDLATLTQREDEIGRYRLLEHMFLGAGIGLVAGGLTWFLVARPRATSAPTQGTSMTVHPVVSANGFMLQIGGRL